MDVCGLCPPMACNGVVVVGILVTMHLVKTSWSECINGVN